MEDAVYSLRQLTGYFLKLGAIGFGGPVALVGYMHRDLVEQRKWISEEDFKEGLALAQLAPGPLAIYLGYVHYRLVGATIAGLAFVLPSFVMVCALGYAYTQAGGLPWMQAVFYGIGAAVIGIIAISSYIGAIAGAVCVLAKRQFTDAISVSIALITALILLRFKKIPEPVIILLAAIAGLIIKNYQH